LMKMAELERIYTVPLSRAYNYSERYRVWFAMKLLRAFLARHMKVEPESVRLSAGINDLMWSHGMSRPPRKLKLKVSKDSGGMVRAVLLEEKKEEKKKAETKPVAPVAGMPAEEHAGKKTKEAPLEKTPKKEKAVKEAKGEKKKE
jgi:large subunit ribosomal protein L31e